MGFGDDLDDTDNALFVDGVIKEAEIPDHHLPHVVARLIVAYAVPFGAFVAAFVLVFPGPCVRFGFEEPICHGYERSGLPTVQFQGRT